MSVNYSLALMSSEPGNPDGEKKFYAKMQASGEVTMDEMAEDIAYATTLTDGDVLNALRALIKQMNKKGVLVKDSKILILGITFKENCPDIRNTKIVDIYHTLQEYTSNIVVYDPWANPSSVEQEYGIQIQSDDIAILKKKFDAIILAVAHNAFLDVDIREFLKNPNGVIFDVKGVLNRDIVDARL